MSKTPLTTLGLLGTFADQNTVNDFVPESALTEKYFELNWGEKYALVCQLLLGKNLTIYRDEMVANVRTVVVGDKDAAMATVTDYGTGLQGPVLLNIVKVFHTPTGLYHLYIKALPINKLSKPIAGLVYLDDVWSAGCGQNGTMTMLSKRRNMLPNIKAALEHGKFSSQIGTILGFTFSFLSIFNLIDDPSLILPGWLDSGVYITPFGVSDKREDVYPISGYTLKEKAEWMDTEMYEVLSALFADGAKIFNEMHHLRIVTAQGAKFFKLTYLIKLAREGLFFIEYYHGKRFFIPSIKLLMAMKQ